VNLSLYIAFALAALSGDHYKLEQIRGRLADGGGGHGGVNTVKGAFGSFRGSRRARQRMTATRRLMAYW
jgi:hypothetical protein